MNRTLAVVTPSTGLEGLVSDYLADMRARGLSPRSTSLTSNVLKLFLDFAQLPGVTGPEQLDQGLVTAWSTYLLSRKLARESVRTYLRTLSTFIRWSQAHELIAANVRARQPKAEHRLVETLSRDEIQALEDRAGTERDKLIVRVLADTGIRLGELLGLRAADLVEMGRERYIKVGGKTGERLVPLQPSLYMRLRKLAGRGGERVFVTSRRSPRTGQLEPLRPRSVQNMVAFLAQQAEIGRRVHPHVFRHSYATWALRRGMNPLQLQKILGHRDLTMISRVYSHLAPADSYAAMLELMR
jgi:integrase/recombinase XerD